MTNFYDLRAEIKKTPAFLGLIFMNFNEVALLAEDINNYGFGITLTILHSYFFCEEPSPQLNLSLEGSGISSRGGQGERP